MLGQSEVKEIQNFLEKAENPLYFYDDDPDGICSFILLKNKYKKGHSVVVKGVPMIDVSFTRKIEEYQPDLIVVLDKPIIDQAFIDSTNVPIIWIDHHPVIKRTKVHYYNPKLKNPLSDEPTTALCYQISNGPLWIATLGCLGDAYIPPFYDEFKKQYPDLVPENTIMKDINLKSRGGELLKILSFILKGKTSETRANVNVLMKVESPYEILDQTTPQGKYLVKKSNRFQAEYNALLEKAKKQKPEGKILLFIYSGKNSFTSELATELMYIFPNKIIIVGRTTADEVKLSFRSHGISLPEIIQKSLINVKGYGGGHLNACGGCISLEDFDRFIDNFKSLVNKNGIC